jgi:hypothetical protein
VTVADIMQVASRWGAVDGDEDYDPRFDVDLVEAGDFCASLPSDTIDVIDIQLVAAQWGATCDGRAPLARGDKLAGTGLAIRIDPEEIDASEGDLISVDLLAARASNLGAFETTLAYDADRLQIEDVALGDFLGQSGNQAVLLENPRGTGHHAVGGFSFGSGLGAQGEGTLASVTFKVLDCGSDTEMITLTATKAVTVDGGLIHVVTADGARLICPVTGVPGGDEEEEFAFRLAPNPSSQASTLAFRLPNGERIHVKIFDASGRLVRTAADGRFDGGEHRVTWDGRNDRGLLAAPGVYFVELGRPGSVHRAKLHLVR